MKVLEFYDLDGTLSKLNNTFDFLKEYFKKKHKTRYFLFKFLSRILPLIPINERFRRKAFIFMLVYNLNVKSLELFYEEEYKYQFINSLTKLGKMVLNKNKKDNAYLLTACIEIPAKNIAKTLGFPKDNVVCTQFRINKKNNKIRGILDDTFGDYKIKYLIKILEKEKKKEEIYSIYYTDDDMNNEKRLVTLFDEVYLVKDDYYKKIK